VNEVPHDLVSLVTRTVKCFICGKALPATEAWHAGHGDAFDLYMHESCARGATVRKIRNLYRRSLKGIFIG